MTTGNTFEEAKRLLLEEDIGSHNYKYNVSLCYIAGDKTKVYAYCYPHKRELTQEEMNSNDWVVEE